jgi:hypothetical protein
MVRFCFLSASPQLIDATGAVRTMHQLSGPDGPLSLNAHVSQVLKAVAYMHE